MAPFKGVITNQKEHFSTGSPFAYPIRTQGGSSKTIIKVTEGATLRISTATIQMIHMHKPSSLLFSSEIFRENLTLCYFAGKDRESTYTSLGIEVSGPCTFTLSAAPHDTQINVFGSIVPSASLSASVVVPSLKQKDTLAPTTPTKPSNGKKDVADNESDVSIEKTENKDRKSNKRKKDENSTVVDDLISKEDKEDESSVSKKEDEDGDKSKKKKKRLKKDNDKAKHETTKKDETNSKKEEEEDQDKKEEDSKPSTTKNDKAEVDDDNNKNKTNTEPPVVKLNKRQRRKLAKLKAKQLAETIDINQGRDPKEKSETSSKKEAVTEPKKKKPLSITRERRLAGGLTVRDIIMGDGLPVKSGRKVSILYEGAFTNGSVFDRNQNKNNPLVFRPGTGAVIRGLERGIEGMKVGGERIVTIPPKLGYGAKGSGNVIPPDSTLVFTVQLLDVGGK